ncbi:MAG: prolyl oligopeptidase family serine peptidase, partial [Planctomycetes bacterium]|nr:prolyl oligopeptidase family serine peptidase [Planctomycetota bacterium]
APRASVRTGGDSSLNFVNQTNGPVEIFWLDESGRRRTYGKLAPGEQKDQHTYAGHVWEIVTPEGQLLAVFQAGETPSTAEISGQVQPNARRGRGRRFDRNSRPRNDSPDNRWTAIIDQHNLAIRPTDGAGETVVLSQDGDEHHSYQFRAWSPDSTKLVAFRIEPVEEQKVYLIESSPRGGGRAKLHERLYPLPGDPFPKFELNIFDVATREQIRPDVEKVDFGEPVIRWNATGEAFTYEKYDRGHQRFRLIEVQVATGKTRDVIDEKAETFIWSAHTEDVGVRRITWLENSPALIYCSERDGWRSLYLVDVAQGQIQHRITPPGWVVRGVDRIDETQRQLWFRASGMHADQDPYFIHFFRVNFDGSGLVALTAGNGNHSVQYSPQQEFLIDSWSRVDLPPAHALRRVSDGSLVCDLEQADISELSATGWQAPEVFVAKGRDGATDIWGIICRPLNFDPSAKYPIIESIYAGPQGSFVPKTFGPQRRFSSLTDLGFIVVQIDGMGTANRSKAFHDVCWKNLKDAGLPDRILWHQAAAKKYPQYDLSRVGIYGVSAGGQNAVAAVLFHSDFYKAAVAGCGCHDNRLDKASWNEQWMGYPVGPQYSECSNIDNAHRLKGPLLLVVGEMDDNVPPESTYRLADALIRADKDFELVVVPGAGHGLGGAYGTAKMHRFFTRHLQPHTSGTIGSD